MSKIQWSSEEQKHQEWALAREQLMPGGQLLSAGTEWSSGAHSFIVMDDRILVLGERLKEGSEGHVRFSEDEAGSSYVVKITKPVTGIKSEEAEIAQDLGIAGQRIKKSAEYYLAYRYLGIPVLDYLVANKGMSLDERYDLAIKMALVLAELHEGKAALSKNCYVHREIHWGSFRIDEQKSVHLIDFDKSCKINGNMFISSDINKLRVLLFRPIPDRNCRHQEWVFGNYVADYDFSYDKPEFHDATRQSMNNQRIYLYCLDEEKNAEGGFPHLHFALYDVNGKYQQGKLDLSSLGIPQPTSVDLKLWSEDECELIQDRVLAITQENGYILSPEQQNKTLCNVLKNINDSAFPTRAFDLSEIMTLCRFGLEAFQEQFETIERENRWIRVRLMNAVSQPWLALYTAMQGCSSERELLIKRYLVTILTDGVPVELSFHEEEEQTIRPSLDALLAAINAAKATLLAVPVRPAEGVVLPPKAEITTVPSNPPEPPLSPKPEVEQPSPPVPQAPVGIPTLAAPVEKELIIAVEEALSESESEETTISLAEVPSSFFKDYAISLIVGAAVIAATATALTCLFCPPLIAAVGSLVLSEALLPFATAIITSGLSLIAAGITLILGFGLRALADAVETKECEVTEKSSVVELLGQEAQLTDWNPQALQAGM